MRCTDANATGVYFGIVAAANGDGSATLGETWLRGIDQTNADGIMSFTTIFPGHYTARATHVHVFVHSNASMLRNGTIQLEHGYRKWSLRLLSVTRSFRQGGCSKADPKSTEVGQMFFDQDLISQVEATLSYTENE